MHSGHKMRQTKRNLEPRLLPRSAFRACQAYLVTVASGDNEGLPRAVTKLTRA
jgi:hypothetical protein